MPNFTKKTSYSILTGQKGKKVDAFFKEIQREADIIENSINQRERQLESLKKDEKKYRDLLTELSDLKNDLVDAERDFKLAVAKNSKINIERPKTGNPNQQNSDDSSLREVFAAQNKFILKTEEYKRKQEEIKNLKDSGDLYPDENYKKEKEHIEFVKKTYKNVVTIFHKLQILHDQPEKTRKEISLKFKPDLDKLVLIVRQASQAKILNNIEISAFNDIIAKANKLTKTYAVISTVLKSASKKFGKGLVSKFSNAYVESAKKSSIFGRVVFSFMGVDKEKKSDLQIESESLLDDDFEVPTNQTGSSTSRATKVTSPTASNTKSESNAVSNNNKVLSGNGGPSGGNSGDGNVLEGEIVDDTSVSLVNDNKKNLDTEVIDADVIKESSYPELQQGSGQKLLQQSSSSNSNTQEGLSPFGNPPSQSGSLESQSTLRNPSSQSSLIDNSDISSVKNVGRSSTIRPSSTLFGGRTSSRVYNKDNKNQSGSSQVVQLLTSIDIALKSILGVFNKAEANAKKRYEKAEATAETAEELQPDGATKITNISGNNTEPFLLPGPGGDSSSGGIMGFLKGAANYATGSGLLSILRRVATSLWARIPMGWLGASLGGLALWEVLAAIAAGYAIYKVSGWAWEKWHGPDTTAQPTAAPKQTDSFLNISSRYYKNDVVPKLSQMEEADRIRKEMASVGFGKKVQENAVGQAMRESGLNPRAEESFKFNTEEARNNFKMLHKGTLEELNIDPEMLMEQSPMVIAETLYGSGSAKGRAMGNTQKGEGWKYRGRGDIQLTGKSRYIEMGKKLGIDLENNPDLAATPEWSAKILAQYYKDHPKTKNLRGQYVSDEEINRSLTEATIGNINLNSALGQEMLDKSRVSVGSVSVNNAQNSLSPLRPSRTGASLNQTSVEQAGRQAVTENLSQQSKEPIVVGSNVTVQHNNVTNVNNGGGGSKNGRGFIKSPLDESSIRLVLGH